MAIPLMFTIKGSVILKIRWQLLVIIIYTTGLVCISNFVEGWHIKFPLTLIPVLGVVTGLLLVFRTNTAYDRYWEGRKLWSTVAFNIRTLTRCIWVMVKEEKKTSSEIIEKISAINLLVAFAYATQNYLQRNYEHDKKNISELIKHLPKFHNQLPPQDQEEDKTAKHIAFDEVTYTNIPIELSYYIAAYINRVERDDLVKGSTVSVMNAALNSLVECLGGFERILRTPIPLAYSVHLDHAVWLYLLSLPYQLIGTLNWFTIPAVTLASFALLGILGIAWEIENPFGTDDNDLPLDDFCDVIHKEILTIIGHRMTDPKDWLLSDKNQPLLPESSKTAEDLIQMEENAIQELLRKGAKLRLSKEKLSQRNNGTNHVAIPIGTDAIKEESEELRPMINNA